MLRLHSPRWLLFLSFPLLFACAAFSQARVAIINAQTALAQTAEFKKAQTDLAAKYKPREDQMAKLQKELDSIQQQLSLGDKLTAQAQSDLTAQSQRKQRELTRLTEDVQAEVDAERNNILARSADQMRQVVSKLAEEKGLDVVIDVSSTAYFKPALDISKEVTEAYDKAYPVK